MFAAGKSAAVSGAAPDDKFNYVTMLLHGDGTNGAQNNTFLDSSSNGFSITRNGNTTQGSFSPYGSNWSNSFIRSASSYITISDSSAFSLGTSDFTIECWIFPTLSGSTQDISGQADSSITTTSRSFLFQINGTGNIIAGVWSGSTGYTITSSSAVSFNTWNHIAFVRSSGTLTLYINGVSVGTSSISTASVNDSSNNLSIGRFGERNSAYYDGYVSNFRMVVGTAIYTGSFTPSTTPLTAISGTALLTCADNRFIDDSTNNFAITANGTSSVQRFNPFGTSTAYSTSVIGGSGYFDGSGDYLTIANNAAFKFGTGDYTIEFWLFYNAYGTFATSIRTDGASPQWVLQSDSGVMDYYVNGSVILAESSAPSLSSWNHYAVVRNGSGTNNTKMYRNGVQVAQATNNTDIQPTSQVVIGSGGDSNIASFGLNGYLSNIRVVKGTAVYTAAFTPPTAPLTAITNTSLLTNFTNGAIFDNSMMNDLETVGNAQISTSVKKYGTGSLAFDGTGDWLKAPNSQLYTFGTGDFTVEFWVYMTVSANNAMIGTGGINWGGSDVQGWSINYSDGSITSSGMQAVVRGGSIQAGINFGALSTNTWTHIALTRSSGTLRGFVGGVLGDSQSNSNDPTNSRALTIGADFNNAYPFTGYIDDLRITKGYARYTATFTPPTSALSDTGPI